MKGFALSKNITLLLLGALLLTPAVVGNAAAPTGSTVSTATVPAAYTAFSSLLKEAEAPQETAPAEVQLFARKLIQTLGEQEGFTEWKESTAAIDPLGPGTHGWLVSLISPSRTPVGYLIIGAKPEGGLALIEYGSGPEPLYNPKRLSLGSNDSLVPLYGGPTLTQWKVINQSDQSGQTGQSGKSPSMYYEAAGGEALPDSDADWLSREKASPLSDLSGTVVMYSGAQGKPEAADLPKPESSVQHSLFFHPDDNILWMTGKSLKLNPVQFKNAAALADKPVKPDRWVLFSSGASRTYAQSLPISGYQLWNQTAAGQAGSKPIVYLISQTENLTRYISFSALAEAGEFKAWTGR
ncbi:hypothetical protein [Paenibacillus physcomitrellae]|uniref:Uncharacterized protein n=1 Tax=Paenibacillus physcomitrellae TaxID=1619311 RepID=A0ABQ1GHY3_9BACL|nr:hypothetical protein [Paenibacillus physcomitrellae]GGA44153.1 hypothetical protein GCM10010917_31790 [Paenibacillus physcomitrellae]